MARLSWHMKVALCAGALGAAVAIAVLTAWVYLEREHETERQRVLECIRAEAAAGVKLPVRQVVDASIEICEGSYWLSEP